MIFSIHISLLLEKNYASLRLQLLYVVSSINIPLVHPVILDVVLAQNFCSKRLYSDSTLVTTLHHVRSIAPSKKYIPLTPLCVFTDLLDNEQKQICKFLQKY